MIQRYLGTTVYGMWCKNVDNKSLPYNTLSRYHNKKRRTYGLTLSPYHIKKTTDQGDAPKFTPTQRHNDTPHTTLCCGLSAVWGLRVEISYLSRVDRNSCFKRIVMFKLFPNVLAGNQICARSARIMFPRLDSIAISYMFQ
jgi:hypothetical protein